MRISDWSSDVCSSDLLKVCPGTLRPLSEIPDDWQVSVTGTESARRIATLARDEIEEYLRKLVLDEDEELARRLDENDKALDNLTATRRLAEADAAAAHAHIEAELSSHRQRRDEAERSADVLQAPLVAAQ